MGKTFILWSRTLSGKSGEDMDHPLLLFLKKYFICMSICLNMYMYYVSAWSPKRAMDPCNWR